MKLLNEELRATLPKLYAQEVTALAADDAILWLWSANAHLRGAFEVIEAWGFQYKTTLTWVKNRMGTGNWLRGQTEHCLLATRGKPVFVYGSHRTALVASRREHSRKPEEFYALVEATSPGSKIELFARKVRARWLAFGNDRSRFGSCQKTLAAVSGEPTGNPRAARSQVFRGQEWLSNVE